MNVDSAIKLINALVYKPGWKISATDHTNRFEGTVCVRFDYVARNSNRDQAENDYGEEIQTYASFPMIVLDCDDIGIYHRIIDEIIKIETHEAREFLRVQLTNWAPFHPHRIDGMKRWGNVQADLQFGIA